MDKKRKPPLPPINTNKDKQLFDPFYGKNVKDPYPDILTASSIWREATRLYLSEAPFFGSVKEVVLNEYQQGLKWDQSFFNYNFEAGFNYYVRVGERKTFYFNADPAEALRRRAYEFAWFELKKQIGESGDNTGLSISSRRRPDVPSYQEITGAFSAPWCASFTSWCYFMAGWKTIDHKRAGLAAAKSWGNPGSLSDRHIKRFDNSDKELKKIREGHLVTFNLDRGDFNDDHVGIFSQWLKKPWENNGIGLFTTIEGNTGPDVPGEWKRGSGFRVWSDEEVEEKYLSKKNRSDNGNGGIYGKKHAYKREGDHGIDSISGKSVFFARVVS